MLQLGVIVLVSLFTVSCGEKNVTACKELCIKATDRKQLGLDSVMSPVYRDVPKCSVIYNDVSCFYVTHAPKTECQPSCLPSSSKIVTEQLRAGPKKFTVVEGCHFVQSTCKRCKRRPYKVKYFEFSRYKAEVDIGRCIGQCTKGDGSDHSFCVPVKSTTKAISGPNGVTAVSVIESCSCESSCYRFSHKVAYMERITKNGSTEVTEKVIDVGRCAGSCNKRLPGRCVSIDRVTGKCLIKLPPVWAVCRPTSGDTVSFTRSDEKNVTIPIVKECGCSYG